MQTPSDETIATEVQQGKSDRFGELVTRYEEKLRRYGRRFLGNHDDIEDMLQEIFIKAYRNIQGFDTKRSFSPWIYRIAHNTFVNHIRSIQRERTVLIDPDTVFAILPGKSNPHQETMTKEEFRQLEEGVANLPIKYREPIVLYYFEDKSYQEIADILRIPTTTVGVRLNRAKQLLYQHFDKGIR